MADDNLDIMESEYDHDELYPIHIKEYDIPWYVRVMHSIPRVDLSFETVKSDFDYNSHKYKESIMFWIAIPILWLLLTLFLFLMYFCYRCCQQDPGKRRRLGCLKWTLAVFTLIACGVIAIGIYGNEDTNKGVDHAITAIREIMTTINKIKLKITTLTETISNMLQKSMEDFNNLSPNSKDDSSRNVFKNSFNQARAGAKFFEDEFAPQIMEVLKGFDYGKEMRVARSYEFYRRLASLAVFSWFLILCFILLAGIGSNSKCTLLMFCAFGIFSLVLSGLYSGLHLGISVGISDVCINPDAVVENYANGRVDPALLAYYIKCDSFNAMNPFNKLVTKANNEIVQTNYSLYQARTKIDRSEQNSKTFRDLQSDLGKIQETVLSLTSLVDCTNVHKDYVDVLEGVCHKTTMGVLLMLLSSLTTGLFFTILVVISSKTWRVIGLSADDDSLKSYVDPDEEETGLFISSSHPQQQSSSSPNYYSYPKSRQLQQPASLPPPQLQQQQQQSNIASYSRRTTPPPAYNSNEFYRQYNNIPPENNSNICGSGGSGGAGRMDYSIRESNT